MLPRFFSYRFHARRVRHDAVSAVWYDFRVMDTVVAYWLETAEHDYATMKVLYDNARYSDALFFGHVVLEKVLKSLAVKKTGKHAPHTHDLTRLQSLSGVSVNESELDLLDTVNDFNIRARYPERKLEFYRLCTKEFTERYIARIDALCSKLCQEAKQ